MCYDLQYRLITKKMVRHMLKVSSSEETLMNVFWKENVPLTSAQLVKLCSDMQWSSNYILKLLGMLEDKGFIETCGTMREGKHHSRLFKPCFDKNEYITRVLEDKEVSTASLAKIAVALVKKQAGEKPDDKNEKLIAELEKMVEQFETKNKDKNRDVTCK